MPDSGAKFRVSALHELMQHEELTKAQFARRANVSRQLLGAWLSETVEPRLASILSLCATFGVGPEFFVEGLPEQSRAIA